MQKTDKKPIYILIAIIILSIIYSILDNRSKEVKEDKIYPETVKVESLHTNQYMGTIAKTMAHDVLGLDTLHLLVLYMEKEFPVVNNVRIEAFIIKVESVPHTYVIRMSKYMNSTSDLIRILSHEFAHIKQFEEGRLIPIDQSNGVYVWEGDTLRMAELPYNIRPHETDARDVATKIEFETKRSIYSN